MKLWQALKVLDEGQEVESFNPANGEWELLHKGDFYKADAKSVKKQIYLVAARSLAHFLSEIPSRFNDVDRISVYSNGKVETDFGSFRYISSPEGLRGHHGIKFEVWGPPVDWVCENLAEIRNAEHL